MFLTKIIIFVCCTTFICAFNISKNLHAANGAESLPVVYYANTQLDASTNSMDWLKLTQCGSSTANLPYIVVSIIQPENPSFDPSSAYTVVEISQCANSFDASCIVGVSYSKACDACDIVPNNNITIPYNASNTNLYIRYMSIIAESPFTIHATYADNVVPFGGYYNFYVFATPSAPSTIPQTFGQYVNLNHIDAVQNSQYNYYFVSFCEAAMPSNQNYEVSITVASDPSTLLAAFDLITCTVFNQPSLSTCNFSNKNLPGVFVQQEAASVTSITVLSSQSTLSQGIWIGVYGYGGELSKNNNYQLLIEENGHN